MLELLLTLVAWAVLTVVLGVITTWTFLLCLGVAFLVVVCGVFVITTAGDGDGNWL